MLFPTYANTVIYTPTTIQAWWDTATAYVSNRSGGCFTGGMTLAQQTLALNQMTAHLLTLSGLIASGNTPGVMVGATIDKISITLEPPPAPNAWQYWLQTTPYGQQAPCVIAGCFGGWILCSIWSAGPGGVLVREWLVDTSGLLRYG